ncbi:MAG TPA: DinB family protein [Thermoanaerobaculia bacterium]
MSDQTLRDHLAMLLDWDHAHARFDDAVKDFPRELRGTRPPGGPHSAWELLEHLRIAQWDILEFTRDAAHESPEFPKGYWPPSPEPPREEAWDESVARYRADLRAFQQLIADPSVDLFAAVPGDPKKSVLREILLTADHNAYHVGQLMMVRRLLNA